ncbi:hypothetical protein ACJW30_11G011400 [Castanea mollissima]
MNAFIHHPLVILLTALETFSYMMTCEIKIFIGASGALFVLLGAMVSKLFTNWTIYANKVLTPIYVVCSTCNSHANYNHKFATRISTSCGQFSSY